MELRRSSYRSCIVPLPVDVYCNVAIYRSLNFAHQVSGDTPARIRSLAIPEIFRDISGDNSEHFHGHDAGTYETCGVT